MPELIIATDAVDNTPLSIITELIEASRSQVERIVTAILATSCLPTEVEQVLDTNALIAEKRSAFAADERDCLAALGQLRGEDFARLPAFDALDVDDADRLRQSLLEGLVMHLVDLRIVAGKLERGIELNRAAMIERFATFAVAGLARDGAATMVSARAFVLGCLVAAHLKDWLESAGYRWTGEKALITLYLNAVGCERRRSKERFVADPIASAIATRLGFRSARQVHQALFAWHTANAGGDRAEPSGHLRFDRLPCAAFEAQYRASAVPAQVFADIMQRIGRPAAP